MFLFSLREEEFNVKSFHIFRGPLDAWHFLQAGTLLKTKGLRVELFQAQVSPLFHSCWSCLASRSATSTILAVSKTLSCNFLSVYIRVFELIRINHDQMKTPDIKILLLFHRLNYLSRRNKLNGVKPYPFICHYNNTTTLVVITKICDIIM